MLTTFGVGQQSPTRRFLDHTSKEMTNVGKRMPCCLEPALKILSIKERRTEARTTLPSVGADPLALAKSFISNEADFNEIIPFKEAFVISGLHLGAVYPKLRSMSNEWVVELHYFVNELPQTICALSTFELTSPEYIFSCHSRFFNCHR